MIEYLKQRKILDKNGRVLGLKRKLFESNSAYENRMNIYIKRKLNLDKVSEEIIKSLLKTDVNYKITDDVVNNKIVIEIG